MHENYNKNGPCRSVKMHVATCNRRWNITGCFMFGDENGTN